MVPELDHVMITLLEDLKQRGMLKNTLVLTLSEFGRTPGINSSLGRDHFASAWSCSLSGCGVIGGSVYGKTDDKGDKVVDGEIGAARLFATIYKALGINPQKNYYVGSRPVPMRIVPRLNSSRRLPVISDPASSTGSVRSWDLPTLSGPPTPRDSLPVPSSFISEPIPRRLIWPRVSLMTRSPCLPQRD
jgi:hypothetical protein